MFVALLRRWNRRINLISRADEPDVWPRHVLDSLQLLPLIGQAERAVDLGSGAGFPGLVLAVASGIPFDLVEADQRKAAFLREAARATQAPAEIHARRIEEADIRAAPLVTARALAPIPKLLALALPLLAPGGACLFPKGAGSDFELTVASAEWQMKVERFPSRTAPNSTILRISEIARAGTPSVQIP